MHHRERSIMQTTEYHLPALSTHTVPLRNFTCGINHHLPALVATHTTHSRRPRARTAKWPQAQGRTAVSEGIHIPPLTNNTMVVVRCALAVGAILLCAAQVNAQCARLPSVTGLCIEEQTKVTAPNRNLQCTANDIQV